MAQERSPAAVEAYARGIAASIIAHYHQPTPKGKAYLPLSPFAMLEAVLFAGIANEHILGTDAISSLDKIDRDNVQLYIKFRDLRPKLHLGNVFTKLAIGPGDDTDDDPDRCLTALANFIKALDRAADSARETDTSTFGAQSKGIGLKYAAMVTDPAPQVIPTDPASRGFNDRTCGRELCPHELLEEFDTNDTLIEDFANYRRDVCAGQWPTFAYARTTPHNPDNIRDGLFDAAIMYLFAMHIICGPMYALTNGAKHGGGVSRGTTNGYVGIEPEIIAYVAVQVWYFYSSATKWRPEIAGFNLAIFHCNIVALFADRANPWVIETLACWNSQIKPKAKKSKQLKKRKRDGAAARKPNDPRETAGLDLALRQAAAAAAAAAGPAPPPPPPRSPSPARNMDIDPGLSNAPMPVPPTHVTTPPQRATPLPPLPPPQPSVSRTSTQQPLPPASAAPSNGAGTGGIGGLTSVGEGLEQDVSPPTRKRKRKAKKQDGPESPHPAPQKSLSLSRSDNSGLVSFLLMT
ncbi:unnamed protein product [Peniophora sp. CBMAI 1063]|nr:unnamed protein product [Peniophora sp. CBMAI 1063]